MSLREYKPGTTFTGRMGRTVSESEPAWYGSPINTPNLDRLTVGRNPGSPASQLYTTPFPFTGTISTVVVDVSGDADEDESEVKKGHGRVAMARQ